MSIGGTLERVLHEWRFARAEGFKEHPLAVFLRREAPVSVGAKIATPTGLSVQGSAGAGQWAAVPWIAVFDDVVTDSATHGYYVVYLFHSTEPVVHLSLNQGATSARAEFKRDTRDVLRDRATFMRQRLKDFAERLPAISIDLGSQRDCQESCV